MIGKVLRGAGRQPALRPLFALCVSSSLFTVIAWTSPAAAQNPPYKDRGLRWVGTARSCSAPAGWSAERLFRAPKPPPALAEFCLFSWTGAGAGPTPSDVTTLFATSRAIGLTEDVPVLMPAAGFSPEQSAVFAGLRAALHAHVGDASLVTPAPARPMTRVVVIDTAPDALAGHIQPGESRHGDTLAHLIEDLVCVPAADGQGQTCSAEVTTVLALPWMASGAAGPHGGYIGTLADLSRAIERAVSSWQSDRVAAPSSTPPHLLLNLSVGWEDTPGIADCSTSTPDHLGPPARAVRAILSYAASQGALIVAAAGNDSGGPTPRTGLTCPGRFQAVALDADPSRALLVAVSGVDYQDAPLATARPHGITGIAGLGLGGAAWSPADPVPPQLTGSSVATAVVSAVSALVWAQKPSWTPDLVTGAVYAGGVEVGAADACPMFLESCRSRRVSACGALQAAGSSARCSPAPAEPGSSPALPLELAALAGTLANVTPSPTTLVPATAVARYVAPSVQLGPWVFPMPIAATCPTCAIAAPSTSSSYLLVPALEHDLTGAALVVTLATGGGPLALSLGSVLHGNAPYVFALPPTWQVLSAFVTGFDGSGNSVTEQIYVEP